MMATLERFQVRVEKGNLFINDLLEKQHIRLKMLFDRHVVRDSQVQRFKESSSPTLD